MFRKSLCVFAFLFIFLTASAIQAQTASLVRDLRTDQDPSPVSAPQELFTFRGKILFSAEEASSGRELWITDGKPEGTRLLADFCPGLCSSDPWILGVTRASVFGMTRVRELRDDQNALWVSDGTRRNTLLLPSAADPVQVGFDDERGTVNAVSFKDSFYVSGCNEELGCGLWKSDGTPAGTRPVQTAPSGYSAQGLVLAGQRLFFGLDDELWVSDGTPAGTRMVKKLESFLQYTAALGDKAVFIAQAGPADGYELWVSDGTPTGTRPLTSFAAPRPFEQTYWLKTMGGKVYFVADDVTHGAEIWATNGTPTGTARITNIGFHNPFDWDEIPFHFEGLEASNLELLGNRVVFWANDGIRGRQPWSTTGDPASTTPLCPDCAFTNRRSPLVKAGSRLVFRGEDGQGGAEVWTTDGTPGGTSRLRDTCPNGCNGAAASPAPLLGKAFFAVQVTLTGRTEMWITDGTPAGTRRFASTGFSGFGRRPLAALGRDVFYLGFGDNGYGGELWASDGTETGTRLVGDLNRRNAGSEIGDLAAVGGDVHFMACDGTATKLWRSSGTAEDTRAAAAPQWAVCGGIRPEEITGAGNAVFFVQRDTHNRAQLWGRSGDNDAVQLTQFTAGGVGRLVSSDGAPSLGGKLLFFVSTASESFEIWRSDGTPGGTAKAVDLPTLIYISDPTLVGNEVWFLASDNDGSEIWRTDGTQAGTRKAVDFGARRVAQDPEFTQVGSTVYFLGPDEDGNAQIWKTDGTPAGTGMVVDLDPNFFDEASPANLTAFQGALYFSALRAGGGMALWRTDGTAAGTVPLKDFLLEEDLNFDFVPFDIATVGSWIVFTADDGVHGRELWRSDGTAAGTTLLRDILPGATSSGARGFKLAGGQLYFPATDGPHGFELWRTDGTPDGTRMVQDIAPEGGSSSPSLLTVAGNRLFFVADDGWTGQELWVLPLSGPACQPSDRVLCLNGGRFKAEIAWRDFEGHNGRGYARALTPDTGYFFFFDDDNVETVVKVLDGRAINGHFWVYYGALSNVEYNLTVTDTQTGLTRRYFNPIGRFASVGDANGFGPQGAYDAKSVAPLSPAPETSRRVVLSEATGTCVPAATRLCLRDGRFAVEVAWEDFSGNQGTGKAVSLTSDTGYFWFFNDDNVETVIKVLDGTGVNGKHWVFYGALSDVQYEITVTDTLTGQQKTYKNPKGRFASVGDPEAF